MILDCLVPVGCIAVAVIAWQMAQSALSHGGNAALAGCALVIVMCGVGIIDWVSGCF